MSKKRIALVGASGRMGRAIIHVLAESKSCVLSHALVKPGSVYTGLDSGLHAGSRENGILFQSDWSGLSSKPDAIIDFSSHQTFLDNLQNAVSYKIPLVV